MQTGAWPIVASESEGMQGWSWARNRRNVGWSMQGWSKQNGSFVKTLGKGFDGDLRAIVTKVGDREWSWSIETMVDGKFVLLTASELRLLRQRDAQEAALRFAASFSGPDPEPVATDPETRHPDLTPAQRDLLRYLALHSEDDHHVIHGARIATALALVRGGLAAEKSWIGPGRLFRLTNRGRDAAARNLDD